MLNTERDALKVLQLLQFPHAVLDRHQTLSSCSFHESTQLLDVPVVTRRKLQHLLYAIQREGAEVLEHALNELKQDQRRSEKKN